MGMHSLAQHLTKSPEPSPSQPFGPGPSLSRFRGRGALRMRRVEKRSVFHQPRLAAPGALRYIVAHAANHKPGGPVMSTDFWTSVAAMLQITFIDLVLAGDN